MKIAILGTGDVGSNLATKIVDLGHEVRMGSRTPAKAKDWAKSYGSNASGGSFADAASFGEIVFNCTSGAGSLEALKLAGAENLGGKILIDVSNPLDFSKGMPPTLTVSNTDSLGEQIQREFPSARVVKALNMVGHDLHVNPGLVKGEHDLFICGNDDVAKGKVTEILTHWFGWKSVIDLGGISASRGMEMYLPLWVTIAMRNNFAPFNIRIVK
jgi:predicted dinucleotide-binding enzyme